MTGTLFVGTNVATEERVCWGNQGTGKSMLLYIFWMVVQYLIRDSSCEVLSIFNLSIGNGMWIDSSSSLDVLFYLWLKN